MTDGCAAAMYSKRVKSLDPHHHGEREKRDDCRSKTRVHQCQAVGPPCPQFEPAAE
jgi:hypothetical protein